MIKFPTPRPFTYLPPTNAPDILYQDDDLVIVHKDAGLLSVPGKSVEHQDCLLTRLTTLFPNVRLVHRLDLATSGVMVFAMNPNAQRHLGLQFEKRYTVKRYVAHIWGQTFGQSGHINMSLITDWPNRPRQKVCFEHGRAAQTDWVLEEHDTSHSKIYLYPKTGRSHQLRVHMLAMGQPILGDRLYAHDEAFRASDRLLLHAESLKLRHPKDGTWHEFVAPCPF